MTFVQSNKVKYNNIFFIGFNENEKRVEQYTLYLTYWKERKLINTEFHTQ